MYAVVLMFCGSWRHMLASMSEIDPLADAPLVDWSELSVSGLLPTGTVTLLLADVEGSTRLWETQPDEMTGAFARAQAKDTITFANGDQLTGKLGKVVYGTVSFHSDVLGDLSIPLTKIKAMHTQEAFAAGSKEQHLTKKLGEIGANPAPACREKVALAATATPPLELASADSQDTVFPVPSSATWISTSSRRGRRNWANTLRRTRPSARRRMASVNRASVSPP